MSGPGLGYTSGSYALGERRGVYIAVVAIDSHHGVLQYMHSVQSLPRPFRAQADGLCLPFRAHTFDVVLCSDHVTPS